MAFSYSFHQKRKMKMNKKWIKKLYIEGYFSGF